MNKHGAFLYDLRTYASIIEWELSEIAISSEQNIRKLMNFYKKNYEEWINSNELR